MVSKANGFFWWQVYHDESIDASLFCVSEHLLLAVVQQGIVVSHEKYGDPKASCPGVSYHLEGRGDGDSIFERNAVGFLYRGTVCDGICERKTKLDDVCRASDMRLKERAKDSKHTSTSRLHGEHDARSLLRSGIACSDIGHKSRTPFSLALCKGRLDLLHVAEMADMAGS